MNINVTIGIIMALSLLGTVWYCVKRFNLMVGFVIMATFWTALALVGNTFSPTSAMEGKTFIQVLEYVYAEGPAGYAKSILVSVFLGAFFGRVLMDTGIATTLIRKVVELSGDKPRIVTALLCIATAIIFMSVTGIGPVISIVVIVLPILLSLGIPAPVAMFSFMGSIMAGIFGNIVNFQQYQTIYAGFNAAAADYTYNNYFKIGVTCMVVAIMVVLMVANLSMNKKAAHAWATTASSASDNAPAISWISVILPVLGVVLFKIPIILGFCLSDIYALITTGKIKGSYSEICRLFAKLFTDGSIDVAPMVGFLLTLAMFGSATTYAAPYFTAILGGLVPTIAITLAIVFAILTPLGFLRGLVNLVGCGTAILAVVVAALLNAPVAFLYPLPAMTTITPQHLDITQSWVAWGFGYTKVPIKDYMKMSIPAGWIAGIICCAAVFVLHGDLMQM